MRLTVNGEFLVILNADSSFPVKYVATLRRFYKSRLSLWEHEEFKF